MKHSIELLNPHGLWMLSALVPLVVLYILKIRRQRAKVPSTWLWASAQRDLLARSPFRRLTPQLPLLLQALAIIALSLALSRPSMRSRALTGDHLAVILDTSASMAALDPSGSSRIELAKAAAIDAIGALQPGADAMLIEAARDSRVLSPLDRDVRRLQEVIRQVQATDAEGDLTPAIALAVDRLRQLGGTVRILVFTDGNLARRDSLSGVSLPIEVVKVGSPIDNSAIVRIDARSGRDASLGIDQVQVFAMVANFGTQQRDLFVTLREQNASDILASRRILLRPAERLPVILTFNPSPGDIGQGLVVDISPHDAMPADDAAYARVPSGARLPVVLAAGPSGSPWLERALLSDQAVQLLKVPNSDPHAVGIPPDALVIVDGACPALPLANVQVVVNPPQGTCLGVEVGQTLESPQVTSWAESDPRLRFLTLDGVHISRARGLKAESPRQELVHTRDGTLMADASAPGRMATIIGFDVGDSDWPLKASFVLFVRNVLESARIHRAHGLSSGSRAGEPIRLSVPLSVSDVRVDSPDGKSSALPARSGLVVLSETLRAGIYHASWTKPSAASLAFSVNLTSEAESDVSEKAINLSRSPDARLTRGDQLTHSQSEWSWLAASVGLILVLLDVWYLTRKPAAERSLLRLQPRIPERRKA